MSKSFMIVSSIFVLFEQLISDATTASGAFGLCHLLLWLQCSLARRHISGMSFRQDSQAPVRKRKTCEHRDCRSRATDEPLPRAARRHTTAAAEGNSQIKKGMPRVTRHRHS
jgi:hypothetical protein